MLFVYHNLKAFLGKKSINAQRSASYWPCLQSENTAYGKDDDDYYYGENTEVVDTNDYYESSQPSKKVEPPKKPGVFVLSATAAKIENGFVRPVRRKVTSTGLYRSCAALASFSDTFDLIFLKKLILNLLLRKFGLVWFGLDSWFGQTDKIKGFWFALVEFGLVWFAYSTEKQTKTLFNFN